MSESRLCRALHKGPRYLSTCGALSFEEEDDECSCSLHGSVFDLWTNILNSSTYFFQLHKMYSPPFSIYYKHSNTKHPRGHGKGGVLKKKDHICSFRPILKLTRRKVGLEEWFQNLVGGSKKLAQDVIPYMELWNIYLYLWDWAQNRPGIPYDTSVHPPMANRGVTCMRGSTRNPLPSTRPSQH